MKNNLKKDIVWNLLGSAIHAFNSLFFLILVTRLNGLINAGYFSYAFIISNIFLTVASFGGKNYQVTDVKGEFSNNTYISFRIITTILSVVLFILLFLMFNYSINKYLIISLLIVTRSFESISDVYHGIIQKNNRLYVVGISLFFKNLLSLLLFVVLDLLFKNITYPIIGWMATNILFLIFVDIKQARIKEFKFIKKNKKILKKCMFYFLYSFINIFIVNIPRYFIDFYLSDEIQGLYGIISMPSTIIILLCQFVLQPYVVKLSEYSKNDQTMFKKTVKKINIYMLIISIISIMLSYIFGIQLLDLIYGLDLSKYKLHLVIVMLGSSIYSFNSFMSMILTIKRKTKKQFVIYVISTAISIIVSWILVKSFGLLGGVISYTITMLLVFIMLAINKQKE